MGFPVGPGAKGLVDADLPPPKGLAVVLMPPNALPLPPNEVEELPLPPNGLETVFGVPNGEALPPLNGLRLGVLPPPNGLGDTLPPPKELLVVVLLPPPKGVVLAPPPNGDAGLPATPNGFVLTAFPPPNADGVPNGLAEGVEPNALTFPNVDGAPNGFAPVVVAAGDPNGEELPPPNGDAFGGFPKGDEAATFPNGELDEVCGAGANGLLAGAAPPPKLLLPPPNGFWPNGLDVDGFAGAPKGFDVGWLPNPPPAPPPNGFEAAPPPKGDAIAPPLSGSPANRRLATCKRSKYQDLQSHAKIL